MNNLSKKELIIILAYYYFESKKKSKNSISTFINKFNSIFKKDFTNQMLMYYCSLFKNVDPSYNAKPININDIRVNEIWEYFITQDRVIELKKIYKNFKQELLSPYILESSDERSNELISQNMNKFYFTYEKDEVKALYSYNKNNSIQNIRDLNVSFNALKLANFKCEIANNHKTFIRKSAPISYTEGHHIVPLKYQSNFNVNLDVEANIVSLCSNCHNQLHYGKDFEKILKAIFTEDRKKRLKKCGIDLTYEELLNMYR